MLRLLVAVSLCVACRALRQSEAQEGMQAPLPPEAYEHDAILGEEQPSSYHQHFAHLSRVGFSMLETASKTAHGVMLATASRTQSSMSDFFDIIENPDHLVVLFYAFLLAKSVSKAWLHNGGSVAEKVAEAQRHRDDLEDAYEDTLRSSEQMLLGMFESSAYVAEWNFQTRARNFEKFVQHMLAHPTKLIHEGSTGKDATKYWCRFARMWFEVFEQCSVNPLKEPFKMMYPVDIQSKLQKIVNRKDKGPSEPWLEEYKSATTCMEQVLASNEVNFKSMFEKAIAKFEYAEKMQAKMREAPPCWIQLAPFKLGFQSTPLQATVTHQATMGKFQDETDDYPVDIYIGYIHVTVLSQSHFLLVFTAFCSIVVTALEMWLSKSSMAVMIIASQFFLVFALIRIADVDEFARLVQEVRELTQAAELVNYRHQKLDKFCRRLRKLDHLWRTRTLPCLEVFAELCVYIEDKVKDKDAPQFIQDITIAMRNLIDGLGEISMWMVDDNESAEFLELAREELLHVREYLVEASQEDVPPTPQEVVRRVQRTFGVLIVRVKSAKGLTNKTTFGFAGAAANPYVTIKTNEDNELVTQTIDSCLEPEWDEEFCMPVCWDDDVLELHVWSNNSQGINVGDDPSLGYVHINFREIETGQWIQGTRNLVSVKKGTEKKSEIHYELYFAETVKQLYDNED